MAQGLVTITNANVAARVDEVKVAYAHLRRLLDHLIVIKDSGGGSNWPAIATATGAPAGQGQTAFDNLDAAMGGMTTAYNALSNMDKNAL